MYCFSASFCFLCLKHYPKDLLLDINKNNIKNTKIVDVLQYCGIDSNYCGDSYQVYICEKCVRKIEPFYVFKQKCSSNFTKLKGYVNQLKSNANVVFHANLKVVLPDPKNGDQDQTIEYMDVSQFVETQIQSDEMETQEKELDKPPEINIIPEQTDNTVNHLEQLYEITKFIYDNHFMNVPQIEYDNNVIEIDSPDSSNDIPQNSSGSFNDLQISKQPTHDCNICTKKFSNSVQLSVHKFLHTLLTYPINETNKNMKYYCAVCSLELYGLENIKEHLVLHTFDKIYTCNYCKAGFLDHADYLKHFAQNPLHKQYFCKFCNTRFITERNYREHSKKHLIKCMFCRKYFKDEEEIKKHMNERHNENFCFICLKPYKSNDRLKIHLFDNHFELQTVGLDGKYQFKCPKCSAEFLTKYSVNVHLRECGRNIIL